MVSKSVLIAAVGVVSALSVGTGTFLAFRATQTSTPVIEASVAPSPAPGTEETPVTSDASSTAVPTRPPASRTDRSSSQHEPAKPDVARRQTGTASATEPAAAPPAATAPAPVPPPAVEPPPATTATSAVETPPVQEPAKPRLQQLTVKPDSVVGIKIDQSISSETARVEDRVTAKVARDVIVDGRTAIAAGTKLEGVVTIAERGGKFRERARVGVRFNTLIMADGLRVPIQTEAIIREGDSPAGGAGSKIGASAVAGAILGGLIGGKRGAVIGTTAGAAGGTAAVAAGGRNEAVIQSGASLTVLLTAPVTITIERELEVR